MYELTNNCRFEFWCSMNRVGKHVTARMEGENDECSLLSAVLAIAKDKLENQSGSG